ncbi:MAG: TlpA family protein disulfide reductase [Rhodocyclales bacterium]|nr:TlpA family protein disulfide reductase [Rhodocyclales bacterium]
MRFLALLLCLIAAPAWSQNSSAPLFAAALHDADDRPFALEQLRGKPLIVNFWARCGPAGRRSRNFPRRTTSMRAGLVVIGIALDDKVEAVRDFARAYEMRYTGLLAKEGGIALMQALGNARAVVPFTLLIDRKGEVIGSKLGAMNHAEIEAAARRLLGAK